MGSAPKFRPLRSSSGSLSVTNSKSESCASENSMEESKLLLDRLVVSPSCSWSISLVRESGKGQLGQKNSSEFVIGSFKKYPKF